MATHHNGDLDTDHSAQEHEPDGVVLTSHRLLARGSAAIRPSSAPGSLDWRQAVGGALLTLGFLAIMIAWYGVSGTLDPGKQMPYISSGGFGGAALIALGVTLLVAYEHARDRAALRDVLSELDAVRSQLEALDSDLARSAPTKPASNGAGRSTSRAARRSSTS